MSLRSHRVQSDERLAALAAGGDDRAFTVLYRRYERGLLGYCRSITSDPEDASDALQNTMLRALAALRRRLPDAPVRPWLFRIAHNESVNVLRRRRGEDVPLSEALVTATAAGAEERTLEREAFHEALAKVVRLPPRQRGALVLRELEGLEYREVASALDVTEVNARQLVFAARSGLTGGRRRGLVAFLPKWMLGAGGALQGLFGAGGAGEMATSVAAKGAMTLAVAAAAAGAIQAPEETPLPARRQHASAPQRRVAAAARAVSASRAAGPGLAAVGTASAGDRAPGDVAGDRRALASRRGGRRPSDLGGEPRDGRARRESAGDRRAFASRPDGGARSEAGGDGRAFASRPVGPAGNDLGSEPRDGRMRGDSAGDRRAFASRLDGGTPGGNAGRSASRPSGSHDGDAGGSTRAFASRPGGSLDGNTPAGSAAPEGGPAGRAAAAPDRRTPGAFGPASSGQSADGDASRRPASPPAG